MISEGFELMALQVGHLKVVWRLPSQYQCLRLDRLPTLELDGDDSYELVLQELRQYMIVGL